MGLGMLIASISAGLVFVKIIKELYYGEQINSDLRYIGGAEQINSHLQCKDQSVSTRQYSYLKHREQIVIQRHDAREYSNAVPSTSRQYDTVSIPRQRSDTVSIPRQCSGTVSIPKQCNDNVSIPRQPSGTVLFPEGLPENNTISFLNLPLETNTAKYVISLFSRFSRNNKIKMVVRNIKEVKNPYLLAMYKLRKEEMISRYGCVEEKLLFHGTHQTNLSSICNDNFNWRRFGSSVGNRYGQGVSFTPEAMYASHYCDKNRALKVMFLVKVLYSKCVIGTEDMIIPFVKQRGRIIICDASRKEDGRVIVKYGDNEFYPAFIIYFESIKL